MKINTCDFKVDYIQNIYDVISKQNEIQAEKFLFTWKGEWVEVYSHNGLRYGKVEDCSFDYDYANDVLSMNFTLSLPLGDSFLVTGVNKLVKMSEKQLTFLKLQDLIKKHLSDFDDNNSDIKNLIFSLDPSDIKNDETAN